MWPVSARFLDTLTHDHDQVSYVDILHGGQVVATIKGGLVRSGLPVDDRVGSIGGKIDVARTSVRRSGQLDFFDLSGVLTPRDSTDLFAYLSAEVRPYVGVRYWDATLAEIAAGTDCEYVPLATLVITGLTGTYPRVSITGYDRMWLLGPFPQQFAIADGTPSNLALQSLLTSMLPPDRTQLNLTSTQQNVAGVLYTENSEVQDAAHSIATAGGQILYVNPMGVFTTGPEAVITDPIVASYVPGTGSVLMRPSHAVDASASYNAVVFTSSATTVAPPLRGYAQDNDPTSMTYAPRVGVRPYFEASPLVTTQGQVDQAALTRLTGILGIPDVNTIPVIPNPAHECGDVIHVEDPDQNLNENVIVDSFSVSMLASDGQQELVCRSRVIR